MAHKYATYRVSFNAASAIRWALAVSLALGLLWGAGAQPFRTATAQRAGNEELQLGKPVERELAGGQSHSYQITLAANQYLNVVVEQRGIDVVVTLFGPDGKLVFEFDNENRIQGEEKVTQIAAVAGSYRLNVQAKQPTAAVGRYEIRLVELRAATQQERVLQEVRGLSVEVKSLRLAGKYVQAMPLAQRALTPL